MPNNGKKVAWVVAVTAAVAMVTASAGCASSDVATPAAQVTSARVPMDLQGLLLNPHDDTSADEVIDVSYKQAMEDNLLTPPQGQTFSPVSCLNFINITSPFMFNGWLQFNTASPVGKDHNLGHDDFFTHFVIELPGAVDVAGIRESALSCGPGTITLESKVTGSMSNTEAKAPTLPGATTLALTQRLQFAPPKNAKDAAVLKRVYGALDRSGGILRIKHIVIIGIGNVLYFGIVPEAELAEKLFANFYKQALDKAIVR